MARTATAEATLIAPGQLVDLRHMVRVLGPESVPSHGISSYEETEKHLREIYFNEGWELLATHLLGVLKGREQGGLRYDSVQMLYILGKRAAA